MKLTSLSPSRCFLAVFGAAACLCSVRAQDNFYLVQKVESYLQTSSSGPVSLGFTFAAEASTATTLRFPAGSTTPLSFNTWDGNYRLRNNYSTKAAMDAAFPNGTYQMTGTSIPTLSFNLATDLYPTATPSVTGGTWVNGVLVLNPNVSNTINFSTNTSFATLGTAGHMEVFVSNTNGGADVFNQQLVSQAAFGMPVSSTPITSFTIPAGTLVAGKLYECEIGFDTVGTLDTTSVAGGGVVSVWSRRLGFYIGASATLTAPTIASQPVSRTGFIGGSASFTSTINVSGAAQNNTITDWYFNGLRIDVDDVKYSVNWGTGTLTVNNLTAADFGSYTLRAINSGGMATSNAAVLTEATNYLSNLSVRAATDSSKTLIAGFVVDGGAKSMLVRAGGPMLNRFGLTGASDPSVTLYNISGTPVVVTSNNDWNPAVTSSTLFSTVGAQPFDTNSKDAALLQTINGPHTANVTTTNSGQVIAEVYDAGTADYRVLSNVSARFQVGTGDNILIAGFVLRGTGTRQLLIRAVGPKLSSYGVTGVLADPQLAVYDGATLLFSNNDWSSSLSSTFTRVGAFALDTNSKDSAIVVTLSAAADGKPYTVQVSGVGNTTGEALVEVYAIP